MPFYHKKYPITNDTLLGTQNVEILRIVSGVVPRMDFMFVNSQAFLPTRRLLFRLYDGKLLGDVMSLTHPPKEMFLNFFLLEFYAIIGWIRLTGFFFF